MFHCQFQISRGLLYMPENTTFSFLNFSFNHYFHNRLISLIISLMMLSFRDATLAQWNFPNFLILSVLGRQYSCFHHFIYEILEISGNVASLFHYFFFFMATRQRYQLPFWNNCFTSFKLVYSSSGMMTSCW